MPVKAEIDLYSLEELNQLKNKFFIKIFNEQKNIDRTEQVNKFCHEWQSKTNLVGFYENQSFCPNAYLNNGEWFKEITGVFDLEKFLEYTKEDSLNLITDNNFRNREYSISMKKCVVEIYSLGKKNSFQIIQKIDSELSVYIRHVMENLLLLFSNDLNEFLSKEFEEQKVYQRVIHHSCEKNDLWNKHGIHHSLIW